MIIELHAHTAEHSACSHISAIDLVRRLIDKNLQGVVLTDHHYQWSPSELAALHTAAGLPDHFIILSGQEVRTKEFGDVLVYGADRSFEPSTSIDSIIQSCPEAALVWAHPYRNRKRPEASALLDPRWDGIEIFNANHTVEENLRGLSDWHRYKFTACSGSDTHAATTAGTYPTIFDHPIGTMEELAEEIKAGRCRPFFKEIPKAGSRTRVTEITIGTKGIDEHRQRIVVKNHPNLNAWRTAERAHEIAQHLVSHGFSDGQYRVPIPLGNDPENGTVVEEGVRGKSLFDLLLRSDYHHGRDYLGMAAAWLAKLHNCRLKITPGSEFLPRERYRIAGYRDYFTGSNHHKARRIDELAGAVLELEQRLFRDREEDFVQGHGDYHPKNIIIGRDDQSRQGSCFIAAIDFESSLCMPPSYDVGTFLAQYRNQLAAHPEIRRQVPESLFVNRYLSESKQQNTLFMTEVDLFTARINLSIARYLHKVGLGASEDIHRVLLAAEQCITKISMDSSSSASESRVLHEQPVAD